MTSEASPNPTELPKPQAFARPRLMLFLSLLLLGSLASPIASLWSDGIDFVVFYEDTRTALKTGVIYDPPALERNVYQHFISLGTPHPPLEFGFFYPPAAMPLFAPFALEPWSLAHPSWITFLTLLAISCGTLAYTFGSRSPSSPYWAVGIAAVFIANPVTYRLYCLGQCSLIVPATIALGQWAYESNRRILSAALWGLATMKPHIAVPFVGVAFLLGGPIRLLGMVVAAVVWNLVGCMITSGTPRTVLEYAQTVSSGYAIGFNSVHRDQILSWNRVMLGLGGPALELSSKGMLASYAVVAALGFARVRLLAKEAFQPAWLLALAAVSSLACAVTKGYDLVQLVLLAPLIKQSYERGQRGDAFLMGGLIALASIPRGAVERLTAIAHLSPRATEAVMSHRSIVVLSLLVYLLIRGQAALVASTSARVSNPSTGSDR